MVVAAAGNLEHERIVELVVGRARFARRRAGVRRARPGAVGRLARAPASSRRRPSSTTCASAAPGIPRGDDRRFALRVLDTILGGSSSSRLFQEVREKRGLAYSVYSYTSQYVDSGQMGLYVGTRPDRAAEALDVMATELRRIVSEPVPTDGARAGEGEREGPDGAVVRVHAHAHEPARLGRADRRACDVARRDRRGDRGRLRRRRRRAGLRAAAIRAKLSAAGVGGDEDAFRKALEPVSESLAAAA